MNEQTEADGDYAEGEEEEEAPRGRRTMLVVAALVGAIGIGGGLAYGYKSFGGGGTNGKPALVKVDLAAKAKPANTGSKEFANTNSKIPERLPDAVNQVASASADGGEIGGPRKVQLIPIGPAPTPSAPSGPPPQGRGASSVPGVTLDNMAMPPARPLPPAVPVAAPPPQVQQAPLAPKAGQARQVAAVTSAPAAVPAAELAAAAPRVPQPPRVKNADAYSPKGPAGQSGGVQSGGVQTAGVQPAAVQATTPASSGGNGYVAVLSSQGSRMDALKVYADLQQKYGEVLSNKPAEVQEASVNGKTWFRAVVGPPGSRQAANDICAQIKAAGHKDCFASAY